MNKDRRTELEQAVDLLQQVIEIINTCAEEEQASADNMPDNLQSSQAHERIEESADQLTEAVDTCNELSETLLELIQC